MRLVFPEASTTYFARTWCSRPSASEYRTPRTRSSSLTTSVAAHFSRTSAPTRRALSSRIWSNFDRSTWYAKDVGPAIFGETENENVHGSGLAPHLNVPPRFLVKPAFARSSATPVRRQTPCIVDGSSDSPI